MPWSGVQLDVAGAMQPLYGWDRTIVYLRGKVHHSKEWTTVKQYAPHPNMQFVQIPDKMLDKLVFSKHLTSSPCVTIVYLIRVIYVTVKFVFIVTTCCHILLFISMIRQVLSISTISPQLQILWDFKFEQQN